MKKFFSVEGMAAKPRKRKKNQKEKSWGNYSKWFSRPPIVFATQAII